jgi:ribosomal protein S18 acetylase RimI-like enzyme
MWRIRPAERRDHDEVLELWDHAGLGKTAPDEWEALIGGPTSAVLVADDAGDLAGAIVATYDGWRAYVYHLAVSPWRRREGIGDALMREAELYLTEAGARHVYVMVSEANTEGLALVTKNGYLPEGDMVLAKRLAVRVAP